MEVLKIENISKRYRLGEVNRTQFVEGVKRKVKSLKGVKEDLEVDSAVNDRTVKAQAKFVWALKDINFSVNKGEVVGLVGRNGAGKSTLLKLLSRVTGPTTGSIKVRGRMASLLEVGTGFHPELTGHENIFLNGAILGMSKNEILAKYDEIVEFSGVRQYVDTPVKRYSSGMYVRLAFSIAVHLEPEILIIDEVLAVGDSEFQKKCVAKMKEIAESGRTVLFVSHNMDSVRNLCSRCILLDKGTVSMMDTTENVIQEYLSGGHQDISFGSIPDDYPRSIALKNYLQFESVVLKNEQGHLSDNFFYKEAITISLELVVENQIENALLVTSFGNQTNTRITYHISGNDDLTVERINLLPGKYTITKKIAGALLPGSYHLNVSLLNEQGFGFDGLQGFGNLTINPLGMDKSIKYPWAKPLGSVLLKSEIIIEKNS